MRFYRVSIGNGEARQYVACATPEDDGSTSLRWTHEPHAAGEFLQLGTLRIVRHLLEKGAVSVQIVEVE